MSRDWRDLDETFLFAHQPPRVGPIIRMIDELKNLGARRSGLEDRRIEHVPSGSCDKKAVQVFEEIPLQCGSLEALAQGFSPSERESSQQANRAVLPFAFELAAGDSSWGRQKVGRDALQSMNPSLFINANRMHAIVAVLFDGVQVETADHGHARNEVSVLALWASMNTSLSNESRQRRRQRPTWSGFTPIVSEISSLLKRSDGSRII